MEDLLAWAVEKLENARQEQEYAMQEGNVQNTFYYIGCGGTYLTVIEKIQAMIGGKP